MTDTTLRSIHGALANIGMLFRINRGSDGAVDMHWLNEDGTLRKRAPISLPLLSTKDTESSLATPTSVVTPFRPSVDGHPLELSAPSPRFRPYPRPARILRDSSLSNLRETPSKSGKRAVPIIFNASDVPNHHLYESLTTDVNLLGPEDELPESPSVFSLLLKTPGKYDTFMSRHLKLAMPALVEKYGVEVLEQRRVPEEVMHAAHQKLCAQVVDLDGPSLPEHPSLPVGIEQLRTHRQKLLAQLTDHHAKTFLPTNVFKHEVGTLERMRSWILEAIELDGENVRIRRLLDKVDENLMRARRKFKETQAKIEAKTSCGTSFVGVPTNVDSEAATTLQDGSCGLVARMLGTEVIYHELGDCHPAFAHVSPTLSGWRQRVNEYLRTQSTLSLTDYLKIVDDVVKDYVTDVDVEGGSIDVELCDVRITEEEAIEAGANTCLWRERLRQGKRAIRGQMAEVLRAAAKEELERQTQSLLSNASV
jgi:hypothetical protein